MKDELKMALESMVNGRVKSEADANIDMFRKSMEGKQKEALAAGLPMNTFRSDYATKKHNPDGSIYTMDVFEDKSQEEFMDDLGSQGITTPLEIMKMYNIPADRYQEVAKILGDARASSIGRNMPDNN